ncbi:Microtubule bundling protein [Taxawa tesnikishii (nom. ined.)]|nr:Microtubule bundling protein [Dothideales sp. JES 119]
MDTSYLSQQVTTIINQLHGYFDEIGVPSHERDSRESELFSALSETLHNQLKLVATEKHKLTEEAQRLVRTIRQMEASLDDTKARDDYDAPDAELKITYPLLECLQALKEKHHTISKLHRERYEQVKKLVEALQSYASHLESSFVRVKLPPTSPNTKISPTFDLSPTYVAALDEEFSRVYEEYSKRVVTVTTLADEIIKLWAELGTPQAQVDSQIVKHARNAPEQLGLHQDDLKRLQAKRDKLIDERNGRERRLKELKVKVEGLWDKLGVEESDRKNFLTSNRGCGLRTINEFEDELSRLNELKRQNLHLFVEDARFKLQELWDSLYFSEEEMLDFTPAFSDVYSDALLSAHEAEIARLETLKEQRAPTLAMIDKHRSLIKDRDDLTASSQDASRLMMRGQKGEKRDPTRLLREEKMRKRIAKELPKVEVDLRKILENWEDEYGRPFLVHGHRYLDELAASAPIPASRAAPPRAKTPCNPPPAAKTASVKTAPSASRAGTLRGPPPARPKTPAATLNRNPLSSSVMGPSSAASNNTSMLGSSVSAHRSGIPISPSKIPSRVPLSSMPHGNNSPERKSRLGGTVTGKEDFNSTIRGRMASAYTHAYQRTGYGGDRSASIIRQMEPEDVYDDNKYQRGYPSSSTASSFSRPGSVLHHHQYSRHDYPSAPPPISRQTSNTSSVMTSRSAAASTVSGSENWETYTDGSDVEDEPDARDAYYARMRANKRGTPEGGYDAPAQSLGAGKRAKGYGEG